ncbi:MAG: DUF4175 family protein [Ignavibacteria bacterium]
MQVTLETESKLQELKRKLIRTFRIELSVTFFERLITVVTILFVIAFLIVIIGALFHLSSKVRFIVYHSYLLISLTTLSWHLIRFGYYIIFLKGFDEITYSEAIGRTLFSPFDLLANAISLISNNQPNNIYSQELIKTQFYEVYNKLSKYPFEHFINFKKLKRKVTIFFEVLFTIIFISLIFFKPLKASFLKFVNYNFEFITDSVGISFEIAPGDTQIKPGENITLSALISSNDPTYQADEISCFLLYKDELGNKSSPVEYPLNPVKLNLFKFEVHNINNGFEYFFRHRGIDSKTYSISLVDYPIITGIKFTITPPAYTGLPVSTQENTSPISCYEGSNISVELTSNRDLNSAIIFYNNKSISTKVSGNKTFFNITVDETSSLQIQLVDINNIQSKIFNEYKIEVIKNEPPRVIIIQPFEINYYFSIDKNLLTKVRLFDDFGFSKLMLYYSRNSNKNSASTYYNAIDIPLLNKSSTVLDVIYNWNLSSLGLKPGESTAYYFEVVDNTGKIGKSEVHYVTFIPIIESLKKLNKINENIAVNLQTLLQDVSSLQKELQKLKDDSKNSEELGLNDPAKRKELQEQLNNIEEKLRQTEHLLEEGINELQNYTISQKTLEEYIKLQEQFNKINTPQFQQMLRKLQEVLKKNNPEIFREELRKINFDEEAFKKQIEKALDIMKKIEQLQKLIDLIEKLDAIKTLQEEIKSQTDKTNPLDSTVFNSLSQKQNELRSEYEQFMQKMRDLLEDMRESDNEINTRKLSDLNKKLTKSNVSNKMQKSSEKLSQSSKQEASQIQEDILNDLENIEEDFDQAIEEMLDSQDQEQQLLNKLKQLKNNIDELSKQQEHLKQKTEAIPNNSELQKLVPEQKELQKQLSSTINDMMNLSKEGVAITPELGKELGNAYNKMENAMKNLKNSNKNNSLQDQENARKSLDEASKLLDELMQQMSQPSNKTGKGRMAQLMRKLAGLIALQEGLNGEISKMGKNGKTGKDGKDGIEGLNSEDKIKLDKLKLQQENIKKSLEELNKEFLKEQKLTGEKLFGDLNEVVRDMEKVIEELDKYNIDDKLIEKQSRILSRMLDAQLSQREKDFEPKRESRPGENVIRQTPSEIVIKGPPSIETLQIDLLKQNIILFTNEYQNLVSKYLLLIRMNRFSPIY